MRRILPYELALHEALPWTVYDEYGNLLLRKGYVVHLQRHLDSLLARGAYIDEQEACALEEIPDAVEPEVKEPERPPHTTEPVDARARRLANSLERLHADLLRGAVRSDMRMLVIGMAHVLAQACRDDADGLIAALHTNRSHNYLVVHQLLGAVLVELVAQEAGVAEEMRTSWVCAALTRDVGTLDVQADLDAQTTPLTGEQRMLIDHHPSYGATVLEQMGVKDALWLQVVREHQERCDGSGYPQRLLQSAIAEGARLLAVVDSYAAMVTPRANRKAQPPREALRALFLARTTAYDSAWVERLLQTLTQYPPGSAVVLANQEHALVRARQTEAQAMQVWAFQAADGAALAALQPRSTAAQGCNVVQAYAWPLTAVDVSAYVFEAESLEERVPAQV